MYRVIHFLLSSLALFCFTSVFAAEVPLKVKVSLYPVSSFEITADRVQGLGKKSAASYSASEIKVPVQSLKTGMSLRDRHLHEKLEAEKYKFITVANIRASGGKGTAKITIRNVSKDISYKYVEASAGKATASFKLSLKDFGFTDINYKGVGVEDEVEVTATIPYQ